jgi:hypothetical protein
MIGLFQGRKAMRSFLILLGVMLPFPTVTPDALAEDAVGLGSLSLLKTLRGLALSLFTETYP